MNDSGTRLPAGQRDKGPARLATQSRGTDALSTAQGGGGSRGDGAGLRGGRSARAGKHGRSAGWLLRDGLSGIDQLGPDAVPVVRPEVASRYGAFRLSLDPHTQLRAGLTPVLPSSKLSQIDRGEAKTGSEGRSAAAWQ